MSTQRTPKQMIESAKNMVSALCRGERDWTLSVPARPDYDPDLVICAGLRAAELEIERLEKGCAEMAHQIALANGAVLLARQQHDELLFAAESVLAWRIDTPTRGNLRDNDASRDALRELSEKVAKARERQP